MNNGCDEYWEDRRKRLTRARRRAAWRELVSAVVYAAMALAAIAGVVWLAYRAANRETFERAAFNEGYYGVGRAEAWQLAKAGVGMTAEEVCGNEELGMRNVEWMTDSACAALGAGGSVIRPYRGEVCHD